MRLVRSQERLAPDSIYWNPQADELNRSALEGFDAVVHLAGENIGAHRWSEKQKARIRTSRVRGTGLLAETIIGLADPPEVFVSSSAIGYYGNREDEILTEGSPPGEGFLAEVCRDWEVACRPVIEHGIRTVILRTGVVLSTGGGALARMLTPFKLGLGGRLGNGRQFMSWISLEDEIGAICHGLSDSRLSGPVNLTAPGPVTNTEFTKTLARTLRRPAPLPVPAAVLRLLLGEMAEALLLAGSRVSSGKLSDSGYRFRHESLGDALRYML
jgi:uncharacterized protein (TIGR01777 family)